jgi:hypothetical protein
MADRPVATAVVAAVVAVRGPEERAAQGVRRAPAAAAARADQGDLPVQGARAVPAAPQVQAARRVQGDRGVLQVRDAREARVAPETLRIQIVPLRVLRPVRGARMVRRQDREGRRDRRIRERTRTPVRAAAQPGEAAPRRGADRPGGAVHPGVAAPPGGPRRRGARDRAGAETLAPVRGLAARTRQGPVARAGAGTPRAMTHATRTRPLAGALPDAAAAIGMKQRQAVRAVGRVAVPGKPAAPSPAGRPVGPAPHDLSDARLPRRPCPRSCVCRPSWLVPAWLRAVPARS